MRRPNRKDHPVRAIFLLDSLFVTTDLSKFADNVCSVVTRTIKWLVNTVLILAKQAYQSDHLRARLGECRLDHTDIT